MVMFAKRHDAALAAHMRRTRPVEIKSDGNWSGYMERETQWKAVLRALIDMFKADNSQFKPDKFEQACYKD